MKTELLRGKIGFLGGEKETWRWEEKSSDFRTIGPILFCPCLYVVRDPKQIQL
jgi:hypothetical protein